MMTSVAKPPLTEGIANGSPGAQNERQACRVTSSMEPELLHPELPANFGEVVKGIYRSAFPHPWNLPSLRPLGLKTIVTLVDEPYTASHTRFLEENGIAHFRIPIQANKDPAVKTPDHVVVGVLEILLNKANHPVLVHCNKGKHRTGCVMACFRRLQGWELRDALSEYRNYSWPKSRVLDEKFIQEFDASRLVPSARISGAALWQPTKPPEQKERNGKPPRHLVPAPHGVRVS
ncbi:tyrosine phosphatase family protein [Aspergillus melleus]|uniref:tyrosine phosphatase family protein n=1 Tax=Aspergillus melleus TaxID=138277 RepID=UPI001E8E9FCA|nr:tyrosine-protein phosphatase siw14 [Aspergillus melleus]KAH8428766.1 tyrosine-protein phosphatase siw14 [Aspergillus melleus]